MQGPTSVRVRPAQVSDAGFLAWAMLAAGRGHLDRGWYDVAFALPEAENLELLRRLALAETQSWWRWDRFLVAETEGRPAAALSAFASSDYEGSEAALQEAGRGLGWGPPELAAVWTRGAYVFTCAGAPSEGETWVVENVASAPEARGRGLAGALLSAALERGRAAGFGEAQISFFIGNAAAERAYAKAGFALAEERRHPDFEAAVGAPGLRRFVRAI
jgi:GNAT superfamily N-acetyltransferase